MLARYNMIDVKSSNIPIATHIKLSSEESPKTDQKVWEMSKEPYASGVESLMYAIVCTRPDLAYGLSLVRKYMANPAHQHWIIVKHIFRYLKVNVGNKSVLW